MDNVFEKYREIKEDRPIEVHFPLPERDILKLLKGVEFNQILTIGLLDQKPQRLHIRVFSADRVKHITWDQWKKIVHASFNNRELRNVIEEITYE